MPIRLPTVEDNGLESPPENTGKSGDSAISGAESGALGAREVPLDPKLVAVVNALPTLPESSKAGILAIVGTARGSS